MDNITYLEVMIIANWLDILIIIIITYSAFKGLFNGLIISVSNLIALVCGILLAVKYKSMVTDYLIVVWHLDVKIASIIEPAIGNLLPIKLVIIGLAQEIISIFSFAMIFIFANLVIKTVGFILNSVFDWGLIAPINKIGGLIFGLIRGVLITILLIVITINLQSTSLLLDKEAKLVNAIKHSYIGEMVYTSLIKFDLFTTSDFHFNNRS